MVKRDLFICCITSLLCTSLLLAKDKIEHFAGQDFVDYVASFVFCINFILMFKIAYDLCQEQEKPNHILKEPNISQGSGAVENKKI